jgi:hypothetical protein
VFVDWAILTAVRTHDHHSAERDTAGNELAVMIDDGPRSDA